MKRISELSKPHRIPIHLINNTDNLRGGGIVEHAQKARVVFVGEGGLKKHAFVEGAVFIQEGDDVLDKGHLVNVPGEKPL